MLKVIKVTGKKEVNDFIRLTDYIYRDCKQYVPDLRSDVRALIRPRKTTDEQGIFYIQPFVAYRDDVPVGRVVGIINQRANDKWQTKNVRFSMIEFVDDLEVSAAMLNAVSEWGRSFGMTHIQGPLGITDFDKEGMLIEDFDMMGSPSTIYNLDYYPRHMEAWGLEKEVDWVQVRINVPKEIPAKYLRVAQYCREQMGLRVIKVTDDMIYNKGYGKKIFDVLNAAYEPLFGFSKFSEEQADQFIRKYLPIIDNRLIPLIVDEEENVVGVAVTMGSLSKAMRKAGGSLWPLGWWHLLKAIKWKREDNAEMLLIGVRPDLQGFGVNALFFEDLIPIYNQLGFRWAETGPQLEDNVSELAQWKPLHPEVVKRRRCYIAELRS
jgi:hypothetical protein